MAVVEVNGYEIGPGADLTGADLEGADLSGASLTGANLTGAKVDEGTIWSEGFDPVTAGVFFD